MADECDIASEREQAWLSAQIEEHAYQQNLVKQPYGNHCRYCGDEIPDDWKGRSHYCCGECCRDWNDMKNAEIRRGRKSD